MGYEIPGQLAIWLALVFNIIAGVAFLQVARGKLGFEMLARRAYNLFFFFTAIAVVWLYFLFFTHNYAFKYVYEYNESTQPFLYILSGFWGGQEGTYLLWLFLSAIFGYLILKKSGEFREWGMAVYALVNLFFLTLLVALSPFALLPHPAADGLGLNPLLRDPWMVVHPPVIFGGYAMAALPFIIAISAMIRGKYDGWVKLAFPWAAVAALLLGAGNILGGYWAYKTLGWGGYWGWDPVENSSLVPWVISLALLHGLVIERRTGALRRTNLLLASFLFLLVVYGTFLTRSGVLADFSVHSFTDLGINNWLVGFLVLFLLLTLIVFLARSFRIESAGISYNIFGREFVLFAGMLILFVFGLVVLFWSSLPIISGLLGKARAADIPTYNSFAIPLAILMALVLTVSPFTNYSEYRLTKPVRKVLISYAFAALIGFGLLHYLLHLDIVVGSVFTIVIGTTCIYLFKSDLRKTLIPALLAFVIIVAGAIVLGVRDYMFLLFLGVAAMAMVANVISLFGFLPDRWRLMGGELTHFGFSIMLIGIMASSAFDSSEKLVIPKDGTGTAEKYGVAVTYEGMAKQLTDANNELNLTLQEDGSKREIHPQLYYSERMGGIMRKPYLDRKLLYDLYFAPQQVTSSGERDQNMVPLEKGKPAQAGSLTLTFDRFEMAQHDQMEGAMAVMAVIDVSDGAYSQTIQPEIIHSMDSSGIPKIESPPTTVEIGGVEYTFVLDRVLPDQGMVVLEIPGLVESGPADQLVLDVSKKPLISLVWAGTTIILLGGLIVVIRRRSELKTAA